MSGCCSYGEHLGWALAQDLVQKPFEAKQPEGKARLMDLLAHSMTRAAKGSVLTLPKLHRKVSLLALWQPICYSCLHVDAVSLLAMWWLSSCT